MKAPEAKVLFMIWTFFVALGARDLCLFARLDILILIGIKRAI